MPEPLGAKLFNLAFKTLGLLDRISGGHEFVGTLIWLNGSAECAIVNFADRHNPRRSQFVAIVANLFQHLQIVEQLVAEERPNVPLRHLHFLPHHLLKVRLSKTEML